MRIRGYRFMLRRVKMSSYKAGGLCRRRRGSLRRSASSGGRFQFDSVGGREGETWECAVGKVVVSAPEEESKGLGCSGRSNETEWAKE